MDNQEQATAIALPGAKIASAWLAVGITSWSDAAAALAALYTVILILEWVWKKAVRPFAEQRGWMRRKSRRRDDA